MKRYLKWTVLGTLVGALVLAGWIAQAQPGQGGGPGGGGPVGARQLLRSFFEAMGAGDLVLLKSGAALSGTVAQEALSFTVAGSGEARSLMPAEIASMTVSDAGDQVLLKDGTTLSGALGTEAISLTMPNGQALSVPKAELALTIFRLNLPRPGQGGRPDGQRPNQELFRVFQGLQAQNIFGLFAQSLTAYDMAVFPDGQIWSGTILNESFVLNSNIFGTLTLTADLVTAVELASEDGQSDFISLNTGDRISGRLAENSQIQFQPVGLTGDDGQPVTLTLERGQVARVSFKQPASAFGSGGRGPGLGGGPGK